MQALARVLRWLNLTRFCTKKISLKHHHRQKGLRLLLPLNSWWLYITKLEISWGKSGNRRENWVLVGIKKNGWKSLGIPRGSFGPEDDLGGVHCQGMQCNGRTCDRSLKKRGSCIFPMLAGSAYGVRRSGHQEEQQQRRATPRWWKKPSYWSSPAAPVCHHFPSLLIIQYCQEGSQLKPTNPKIEFICHGFDQLQD